MSRRSCPRVALVALVLLAACSSAPGDPATSPAPPAVSTPTACPARDGSTPHAPTVHEGEVHGAETWAADGSPHVVRGDVNVRDGAKLTIAPCALVQLEEGASINVAYPLVPNRGDLVAEGTADAPVRFEGRDGARWDRIYVHAPGTARLVHTTLVGGGGIDSRGHETLGATGDGELPRKTLLHVEHVQISGSRGAGVRIDGGASFAAGSRDLVIRGSGAGDPAHPYPLEVGEQAVDLLPTGIYTGNARDEIKLEPEVVSGGGGFQEDAVLRDRGVPYHVGDTPEHDSLRVGNGNRHAVLTVEAGVKVLFERNTGLDVEADDRGASAIRALGTADRPVVLTSAASVPRAGDWRGLYFNGPASAKNALEHVHIEYTGADCACSMVTCSAAVGAYEAAIVLSRPPAAMFLRNAVLAHGKGHGVVQGYDGRAFDWVTSNRFEDLAGCAVTLPRNADTSCPDPLPSCK